MGKHKCKPRKINKEYIRIIGPFESIEDRNIHVGNLSITNLRRAQLQMNLHPRCVLVGNPVFHDSLERPVRLADWPESGRPTGRLPGRLHAAWIDGKHSSVIDRQSLSREPARATRRGTCGAYVLRPANQPSQRNGAVCRVAVGPVRQRLQRPGRLNRERFGPSLNSQE